MIAADAVAHIYRDETGVAWIDQTNVKVIEVVLDHLAYGWSAEEMHRHQPHLSLAQFHAALAFYYDHQEEFDTTVAESLARADTAAKACADSPGRRRLQALGKLP
ncbi:MAG: DUF433 domain-containing protein [Verrucomicrobia bacterium]|nr:DUF433 domain-containing protein [Verrucomicrobiota bacterium]